MSELMYYNYLWNAISGQDAYYKANGCRLNDAIRCEITQELNGMYECDVEYPEDGLFADTIRIYGTIECEIPNRGAIQRFEIYRIERRDHVLYITAYHISYRLSWFAMTPKEYSADAWETTLQDFYRATPGQSEGFRYSFTGVNLSNVPAIAFEKASNVYANMMAYANAIGGFWVFDNKDCYLKQVGTEYDERVLRYDSNLSSFSEEVDGNGKGYMLRVFYSYRDSNGNLVEKHSYQMTGDVSVQRIISLHSDVVIDATDQFSSVPSQSELDAWASAYVAQHPELGKLTTSYSFNIIPITVQVPFQVGDYLTVTLKQNTYTARIRKIVIDGLANSITSIETDDEGSNLYSNIQSVSDVQIKEDDTRFVIIKQYQYTYSIAANGRTNITGGNFGVLTPEGYRPASMGRIATGSTDVVMRAFNYKATGSGAVLSLVNLSSTALSNLTATVEIMYFKKEHVTT